MNTDTEPAGLGDTLIGIAHEAIARELGIRLSTADAGPAHPATTDEELQTWLSTPAATFVTLTIGEELRGCIGTLEVHRPLARDVRENAVAAAFDDPRFPPLSAREFPRLCIEVSILSQPEPLHFQSEDDALCQLVPGRDGLVLSLAGRRATFLPQVWEDLPDPYDFLAHLKAKAGLPSALRDPAMRLDRYTVKRWKAGPWPVT
jgi:AmmeMemoRadiSam system protein A